jgi:ATP/maltotriose-dependent transcriptional regulator MalT
LILNKSGILKESDACCCTGIGKTVLAKQVAHDPEVQQTFSDGIVWVTMGDENPDMTSVLAKLLTTLNPQPHPGQAADAREAQVCHVST